MTTSRLLCLLATAALLVAGCVRTAAPGMAAGGAAGPAAAPAAGASAGPAAAPAEGGAAPGVKKLNKFTGNAAAIQEGRKHYLENGCSGCHGVGGGGGMAPPVTDDVWVFGSDDETLFKLIKGQNPKSTMPQVYSTLPDDEVWKMLAYIRSLYAGDPSKINW